jgi:TRAP-type C4-dicarboxylate transport system permease small subunit
MRAIAKGLLALDKLTTTLATVLACVALAVAVAAGTWQVVARFATNTPAVWSEALVRASLIWMVFLGLAVTLRVGALVSIDLAHRLSPRPLRRVLETLSLLSSLSLMGVLFWFGWTMAQRVQFQIMAGMEISMSYAYAAIPVGAAFALVGAVAHWLDRRSEELESAV